MRARLHILPCVMLVALAGCASGDLTIDAMVTDVLHSVAYRLEPTGRLTVLTGGGAIEGERAAPIHTTHVDEEGMARLKKVVADSGFLLASPPLRAALNEGPSLRLDVRLGMWHNIARLHGTRMASATKIIDQMNRHLPAKYVLHYDPPPLKRPEEEFDRMFR